MFGWHARPKRKFVTKPCQVNILDGPVTPFQADSSDRSIGVLATGALTATLATRALHAAWFVDWHVVRIRCFTAAWLFVQGRCEAKNLAVLHLPAEASAASLLTVYFRPQMQTSFRYLALTAPQGYDFSDALSPGRRCPRSVGMTCCFW